MSLKQKRGFTLIELLVVVLIIAILAVVALPQYQKAVLKSRTVQLQTLADALRDAQRVYYLAHGAYAEKFEDLDIDLPAGATITPYGTNSEQADWPNGMKAFVQMSSRFCYVRDTKKGIGIISFLKTNRHRCVSYYEIGDQVCESLGGVFAEVSCATAEALADGAHGCRNYEYP